VLACWNMIIPYLCPSAGGAEGRPAQPGKGALVYTSVAVRNRQAPMKLGIREIYGPGTYYGTVY
jgi:hypothetical protein